MTAAAAFSHRPWTTVVATALWRTRRRVRDVIAVVAAMAIPLGMSAWPEIGGAIQRLMFAVAYTWYGTEAVREIVSLHPPCRDRRSRIATTVSAW
jgi:hypothetical protein